MASKVNVKFVVILGASLVIFAGIVGLAGFMLVFKSGAEHAKIGDRYAAEGDWELARRSYSKAVFKESTEPEYLLKWAEAIENLTPTSETEYRDRLMNDLMSALMQLSEVMPSDAAIQSRMLEFLHAQFRLGPASQERAIGLMDRATISIERFENASPADDSWKTLYRYRGIPMTSAMISSGLPDEPLLSQARTDLEFALQGNPADELAVIGLSWWHSAKANQLRDTGKTDEILSHLNNAITVLDTFLAINPNSPRALIELEIRKNQSAVIEATRGMLADDSESTHREMRFDLAMNLPAIADVIISVPAESIDPDLLLIFLGIEQLSNPEGGLSHSRRIADHVAQARPDDARILIAAAEIDERRQDADSALIRYDQIAALSNLPVSIKGFVRISLRRDAKFRRARTRLDAILTDLGAENKRAMLDRAIEDRLDYAQQVSEDDPQLILLDGMIAHANDDLTEARELYRRYNEQTLSSDPRGLWRQVQTAMQLNFITEAESLLNRMIENQPGNRTALAAQAEVQYRLNRKGVSLRMFEALLQFDPNNAQIIARIDLLRAEVDPEAAGADPILVARFEGQSIRMGSIEEPGDLEAAAEFLQNAMNTLGMVEPLALDLIQIYLDLSQLENARSVAAAASQANPESEVLARFSTALQSDSVTGTLITLIEQSDRSEFNKFLTKYQVYLGQGEIELAMAELDKAAAIEPENPRIVEIRFDNAIGTQDLATADEIAQIATRLNLDRAGGALYRSRVLSANEKHDEAITLLQQTIAQGKTFPMAYRQLAREYALASQFDLAIQTLENALALNEDDAPTQLQYIRLLSASGRSNEALEAARRMQDTGIAPKFITEAWLELEAIAGNDTGRAAAIVRRESIRNLDPDNRVNNASLAELYILTRQFEDARPILNRLRDEEDDLALVILDMRWHADQGRLLMDTDSDGELDEAVDGVLAAQRIFQDYLLEKSESELTSEFFMAYARFMIGRNQIDLAMPAIEQARELQSETSLEADKLLGDLFYSRSRFAEAVEVYERLVGAGADTADQSYLKRLIESLIRVSRFDDALAGLDSIGESDLTSMLQRAEILFGLDRTSEARSILDQAVQQFPTESLVYVRRAEANLGSEDLAGDVMADLEAALRVDPTNWRALRLRGVLQWREGRRDQAISDIRAAVAANPQLDQLLYGLMNELIGIGREGQAADIADTAIAARPTDAQLMLNCARVFAGHDLWEAATEYTDQAWVQSKDPQVGVLLIDSMVRLDPPLATEAEAVYTVLLTLVPEDAVEGLLMLTTEATVRHAQGRENSTVRSLTQALTSINDNPGEVLNWAQHISRIYREDSAAAAQVMQRIGNDPTLELSELVRGWLELVTAQQLVAVPAGVDEGIAILRTLRDLDDADLLAKLAYRIEGTVRFNAEDFHEAKLVWYDGLTRFPDDWEMLNNLAFLLGDKLDSAAEGLDLSIKAAQLAPEQLSTHDTLALIYTNLGRFEEAESTLLTASALAVTTAQQVTVSIARIRLLLAKGDLEQARKLSSDTRSVVFGSVGLAEMSQTLDQLDTEIDSASP